MLGRALNNPLAKIELLLNRLFEGRLLPFVGAGISINARIPDDPDFIPSLAQMRSRLADDLRLTLSLPDCEDAYLLRALLPEEAGGTFDTRHENVSFDRLADTANWLWGTEQLCECLEITRFRDLKPLPAHRYLAYLTREGLIGEVISTNYDCCIEKAYLNSFGAKLQPADGDTLKPIRDLEEYRSHAGLRQDVQSRPTLRLYKINGCADALVKGDQKAEGILLTERQLQGFHSPRQWVHDLLADRARRYALLICGFGSEEPQVRHTALSIIKEFGDHSDKCHLFSEDIAALPNAPFVVAYREPGFTQVQILAAFHQAHNGNQPGCRIEDHIEESVLWGDLAPELGGGGRRISADFFFMRLHQAAFGRLLDKHSSPDSDFDRWLSGVTRLHTDWARYAYQTLYPTRHEATLDHLFGRWRFMLTSCRPLPLLLWRWLWAVQRPDQPLPADDWYLPWLGNSRILLAFLTLLAALVPNLSLTQLRIHRQIRAVWKLGLQVNPIVGPLVYLVREGLTPAAEISDPRNTSRLLLRIALPTLGSTRPNERWQEIGEEEDERRLRPIRTGRYLTVPFLFLVEKAQRPANLAATLRRTYAEAPPRALRVGLEPL